MPQLTMLNENKSFGVWCAAHPVKWDCIYWPSGSLGRKWNFSVPVKIENRLGLGDKQGLSRAHKSMELLPLAPAGMGCGDVARPGAMGAANIPAAAEGLVWNRILVVSPVFLT